MEALKRIGWIGVGAMGGPMAARLRQAGHTVTACGSSKRDLSQYARENDILLAASPAEVAAKSDIVFTMIPNGAVLISIAQQLAGSIDGKILVDMSTVDPESSACAAETIHAAGGKFLRAPVTGSTHYAKAGTLGIMVSGEKTVFETCLPCLKVLGDRQTYLGPGEEARYMKIIINMMLAQSLQAFSEALVLSQKLELPWQTTIDLIADSAAAAPIIRYKASTMKQRDFEPTSTGYNMHKDMKMATELAESVDADLPTARLTMQMYDRLMEMGLSQKDNTSILLVNEALNRRESTN